MHYNQETLKNLRYTASQIRLLGMKMVKESRSGHLGGAFSMAEILSVLYFGAMTVNPKDPEWPERDRLVLSKGHGTVGLYPALALKGFFPIEELATFRKMGSRLSGHAEMHVPGVDMSTGSLGQGLSVAVGMALNARIHGLSYHTYAICGDGEIQEGQIWEAAMFAAQYCLDRLTMILDHNKLQLDGAVAGIINIEDVCSRFEAFGWQAVRVDGHDAEALLDAVHQAHGDTTRPTVIVADTIKGKGVSFMENHFEYHGHIPSDAQFDVALAELEAACVREGKVNA